MKSYYAVIPADVRYDKSIPANAKLLYGEITALCNEKGFCWATNTYFAELYDVSERTVRLWICSLKDAGYIEVDVRYKDDGKTVDSRCISISPVGKKSSPPSGKNFPPPPEKNFLCNNTDIILQENKKDSTLTCTIEKSTQKRVHGQYKNVRLTDEEYVKLHEEYANADEAIEFFSAYIAEKGYKGKSHYLSIRRWVFDALVEREQKRMNIKNRASPPSDSDKFMESLRRIRNGEC